jgi:hypothetical protein
MGIETAALAIGAGSSLLGTVLGYGEQRAARRRAAAITDGGNSDIESLIQGQLNSGQDSYSQYLRRDPNALQPFQFDLSKAFQMLQGQDRQVTADQVAGLRSSVGSLGERFGTGFASREALLRSRIGSSLDARNAGIAQSSFDTALNTGLQDFNAGRGLNAQLLGLLLNARNSGVQTQLAGLGVGTGSGQTLAQGGIDISQLLLLSKFLKPGGTGGAGTGGGGVVPLPQSNIDFSTMFQPSTPSLYGR